MNNPSTLLAFVRRVAPLALALGFTVLAAGCAGDDTADASSGGSSGSGGNGSGGSGGSGNTGSGGTDGTDSNPLYVIATSFTAGDQTETYLVTTDSWNATTVVDPTDGPKLLGGVVPIVHGGSVFVADSSSPVLRRYDVNSADKLVVGDEFSFMGTGLTELQSWHIYIVSDDKGYVFDPAGPRIIIWNPSEMQLTGEEIDLSEINRDGWSPNLVFEHLGPQRIGDQLFIPLGWYDQDGTSRHASGVLVVDVTDDSVVAVDEDERCGESYSSIVDPDRNIYFFPPDWSALPHFYADGHAPTCVLRITAGETQFDSEYLLDLSGLVSGVAAAGAIPDGDAGFFFEGVDEELYDDGNNEAGTFWRMYHYNFATEEARAIDSLPVWGGQSYWVNVGGDPVIPYWRETDDGWVTTMYGVNGSADPEPVFSFDASWYGAGLLRDNEAKASSAP